MIFFYASVERAEDRSLAVPGRAGLNAALCAQDQRKASLFSVLFVARGVSEARLQCPPRFCRGRQSQVP